MVTLISFPISTNKINKNKLTGGIVNLGLTTPPTTYELANNLWSMWPKSSDENISALVPCDYPILLLKTVNETIEKSLFIAFILLFLKYE